MGKKRFIIGGLAAGAVALAVMPAMADSQPWTGPNLIAQCQGAPIVGTGDPTIDGAQASPVSTSGCFKAAAGATAITVNVVDGSGANVPYNVSFQAPDGATSVGDIVDGCAGAQTISLPAGTGYVYVFIDDPADAAVTCGAPSTATSGTINLDWLYPAA
ncbi:MAG TPA: hypothetical protein VFJ17_03655 [Mycobacteriales bacterium]|nr:hypothetical protein [Mycobacteriales bacterium]